MPARLSVFFPDRPVRRRILAEGESCLIGRGDGCGLALDDARVSRRHARLAPAGGGWRLEDLGSKNGTLVDGDPPSDAPLPDFAWITLGGLPMRFERLSDDDRRLAVERDRERWQTSVLMQRRIDPSAGLETVLEQTLAAVLGLCEAERAGVVLVGADGGLEVAAAAGEEPLAAPPPLPPAGEEERKLGGSAFAGSRGAIERALASGRPLTLSDARSDSGLGGRASVVTGGIRALVCLPLRVLGRSIGALYADSRRAGSAFTELDVEVLEALAHHAALAVAVTRLQGELDGLRSELPTQVAPAAAEPAAGDPLAAAWERALPAWTPVQPEAGAGIGTGAETPAEKAADADGVTRAIRGRAAAGR